MKIGNVEIKGYAALAPMAGVADKAFRQLCVSYGAALTFGELTSAKAILMNNQKSFELLKSDRSERPFAAQLFGCEPDIMAKAAVQALGFNPDLIDINMGCPAPKVISSGGGSLLMKNPVLAGQIVKEVVKAVPVPVTAKIRTGWDDSLITAVEVAKRCEDAGAFAITVHGRTREQMYAPPVSLDMIAKVKQAVAIPVIGNGDIYTAFDAAKMFEETGCDLVMVGRGALGNPFLFAEINAFLEHGKVLPKPSASVKMATMLRHVQKICEYKGEYIGIREARKHAAWYIKGIKRAASLRKLAGGIKSVEDLEKLAFQVCELSSAQNS